MCVAAPPSSEPCDSSPSKDHHSWFTRTLLGRLGSNASFESVLHEVREAIVSATGTPANAPQWVSNVKADFVLSARGDEAYASPPTRAAPFPLRSQLPATPPCLVGAGAVVAKIARAFDAADPGRSSHPGVRIVALHGAGGIGKSTYAAAFVDRSRSSTLYPAGAFWLSGSSAAALDHSMQQAVDTQLGGMAQVYHAGEEACVFFVRWLASQRRRWLVVVDDASVQTVLSLFLDRLSSRCGGDVLVTTTGSKATVLTHIDGVVPVAVQPLETSVAGDMMWRLVSRHNVVHGTSCGVRDQAQKVASVAEAAASFLVSGEGGGHAEGDGDGDVTSTSVDDTTSLASSCGSALDVSDVRWLATHAGDQHEAMLHTIEGVLGGHPLAVVIAATCVCSRRTSFACFQDLVMTELASVEDMCASTHAALGWLRRHGATEAVAKKVLAVLLPDEESPTLAQLAMVKPTAVDSVRGLNFVQRRSVARAVMSAQEVDAQALIGSDAAGGSSWLHCCQAIIRLHLSSLSRAAEELLGVAACFAQDVVVEEVLAWCTARDSSVIPEALRAHVVGPSVVRRRQRVGELVEELSRHRLVTRYQLSTREIEPCGAPWLNAGDHGQEADHAPMYWCFRMHPLVRQAVQEELLTQGTELEFAAGGRWMGAAALMFAVDCACYGDGDSDDDDNGDGGGDDDGRGDGSGCSEASFWAPKREMRCWLGATHVAACVEAIGDPTQLIAAIAAAAVGISDDECGPTDLMRYDGVAAFVSELGVDACRWGRRDVGEVLCEWSVRACFGRTHSDTCNTLLDLGTVLQERNALDEAEEVAREALRLAEDMHKGRDHVDMVLCMRHVGVLCKDSGRLEEALRLLEASLSMERRLNQGKADRGVAASMCELGDLFEALGDMDAALRMMTGSLAMLRRVHAHGDHVDIVTALHRLGTLYTSMHRWSNADFALDQALARARRLHGDDGDHPDVAALLYSRGSLFADMHRYTDAENALQSALEMLRRLHRDLDHPDIASAMYKLGSVLLAMQRLEDAEGMLQAALSMQRRVKKRVDDAVIASVLHKLGALYKAKHLWDDAEHALQESLAMRKRLYAGDHRDVAASLHNLGVLYHDTHRWDDALEMFEASLDMLRRLLGDSDAVDLVASLHNLGMLYKDMRRWGDAEEALSESVAMERRLHRRADHPEVAASCHNLGMLYKEMGQARRARHMLQQAVNITRRLYQGDHIEVAASIHNLGIVLAELREYHAAERQMLDALAMVRRLYGDEDHSDVVSSLRYLGGLYVTMGRFHTAAATLDKGFEMAHRLHGDQDHRDTSGILLKQGELLKAMQQWDAAERTLGEALAMEKRMHRNRDHKDISTVLQSLGRLYWKRHHWDRAKATLTEALEMEMRIRNHTDHSNVAVLLHDIGLVYRDTWWWRDAEVNLTAGLEMRQRLSGAGSHRDVVTSLNGLAELLQAKGCCLKAQSLYSQAIHEAFKAGDSEGQADAEKGLASVHTMYVAALHAVCWRHSIASCACADRMEAWEAISSSPWRCAACTVCPHAGRTTPCSACWWRQHTVQHYKWYAGW